MERKRMRAPSRRMSRVSVMWRLSVDEEGNVSIEKPLGFFGSSKKQLCAMAELEQRRGGRKGREGKRELTKENQPSRERSHQHRVSTLPHDPVHHSNRQTPKHSWHAPHSNVGNVDSLIRIEVLVADVFEVELSVEACEVSSETVKHLGEGRVDVEVVFSEDVVGGELGGRRKKKGGELGVEARRDREGRKELKGSRLKSLLFRSEPHRSFRIRKRMKGQLLRC